MIDLAAASAADAKQLRVQAAVARFADLAPLSVATLRVAGPRVGYRQRAKLVADEAGRLGLYRAGTHEVEDLPGCIVLEPLVQATVAHAREQLRAQPILRGLDVVRVDEGTLVTLITSEHAQDEVVQAWANELMQSAPHVLGVARSRRADDAVQLLGKDLRVLRGQARAKRSLKEGGAYALLSHGSFVQAHRDVAAAIHDHLRAALREASIEPPARLLELYAGSGSLALALAQAGFDVTAIESFAPACQELREAAREQGLRVSVETADAAQGAMQRVAAQQRYDAVLVNPPRRGLEPDVRKAIGRLRPRLVTYVSCEPTTLARDLSHFAALGYAIKELVPFDMMPLTDQVETVAILERAASTALDVVHEDEALLAINKRPHAAITSVSGEESLLDRVRQRAGFERASVLSSLAAEESGLCLFARHAEQTEELQRALDAGSTTYLALLRGVVRNGGKVSRAVGEAREAATRFRRQEVVGGHSLVRATPVGREQPDQLARHFAALGHPLLGARGHGDARSNRYLEQKHMLERPFLHRERVVLKLPSGSLTLTAPLAPDLALSLDSLRNGRATRPETP